MIFSPIHIGNTVISRKELEVDKENCLHIGPCGIGRKALYLNSFYIDRMYYVSIDDISRVFKRVAISKGGYTGHGVFGSMSYIVVQLKDGTEKQCKFKYEEWADEYLETFGVNFPGIPLHSEKAEKKLAQQKAEEEARYLKNLSPEAEKTLAELRRAEENLSERPHLYEQLSFTAKQKRTIDNIDPSYRWVAVIIFAGGIIAAAFGLYRMLITKTTGSSIYFVLFGIAAIFMIAATRILPTGKRNKKSAQDEWDNACREMDGYVRSVETSGHPFPVQSHYAHPIVIRRMIRVVREGKADNAIDALNIMEEELKGLDSSVKVTQEEHDEVVAIKPMFLLCDYK